MKYLPIIGLEIHIELKTDSKMFCGCPNNPFASRPNTNVCPVCLGLPGALPTINIEAVKETLKIGRALGSKIAETTSFDRKSYFYPDLPKGYQISQFHEPIAFGGILETSAGEVKLDHIHLEEDTGKLTHPENTNYSLINYNRAGVPLVELVTRPCIHSSKQAREFCQKLQQILRFLKVSNADMEKGEMRCEVNISLNQKLKIKNQEYKFKTKNFQNYPLGIKVEIKNLNSFKVVEKAIDCEIKRQTEILNKGKNVIQETRGWNEKKSETTSQRIKETSADYRYFPEPDLPPLELTDLAKEIRIPKMPDETKAQLQAKGVDDKTAEKILKNKKYLEMIDQLTITSALPISELSQIITNLPGILSIDSSNQNLKEFFNLIAEKKISREIALKQIYPKLLAEKFTQSPKALVEALAIKTLDSQSELEKIITEILEKNPAEVQKFKAGKTELAKYFMGLIMSETKGQADPALANQILQNLLK